MKPCPFCGGRAIFYERIECIGHGDYIKTCSVKCSKCHAEGPQKDEFDYPKQNLKQLAKTAWDERS